jgi:hypothetical protein
MKMRTHILLAALFATSCMVKSNRNSAIIVTKVVKGTAAGTPPNVVCTFSPGDPESAFVSVNPAVASGFMGVVIVNQLTKTDSLNSILRTDSSLYTPHQVVADYEVIGGQVIAGQIIPVSGGSISGSGGTTAVITPFFFPPAVKALQGTIRVTFHIEGRLDDGTNVKSTEHEYIFVTCSAAGCSTTC